MALIADHRRTEIHATDLVPQDQGWSATRKELVAPTQHGEKGSEQIFPFIGQSIFKSIGSSAVLDAREDALCDQPMQALGQNVGGDAKFRLQIIEPTKLEKSSSQDPEAPTITDHFVGSGHRTGPLAFERCRVRRAATVTVMGHGNETSPRAIPIADLTGCNFFLTVGTDHNRTARRLTYRVGQLQRFFVGAREPAITECHQTQQYRVQGFTRFGEPVFPPWGAPHVELCVEQPVFDEALQAVREGRAGQTENFLELFKTRRAEVTLAQDHETPAVANDVNGASDGAAAFSKMGSHLGRNCRINFCSIQGPKTAAQNKTCKLRGRTASCK